LVYGEEKDLFCSTMAARRCLGALRSQPERSTTAIAGNTGHEEAATTYVARKRGKCWPGTNQNNE